jgi:type IV secretion system protein VirB10
MSDPVTDRDRDGEAPQERPEPARENTAAFRLRPERPRVVQLSRKVIAGGGAVAALGVGGALVWALHSSHPSAPKELYSTENRQPADGLSRLPKDYAGVPKLGPPLPGDLGRPMVAAGVPPQPIPGAPVPAQPPAQPDPETQRLAQERARLAQEVEASRTSRVFATEARAAAQTPGAGGAGPIGDLAGLTQSSPFAASPQGSSPQQPSETDRRLAFLNGPAERRTISSERIQAPASRYVLQAGAVIPAALVTGLRSDLPGQVTAQVTEAVYDGPTGRTLLIPQGSRLVGQYDAQTSFGQRRALLVWNRLILPDGRSIVLERQPGTDPAGFAGLEDEVDNHWGEVFRAAAISTLLSVGAEAGSGDNESDLIRAIRQGSSDSISQTGRQIVGRSLNVQPTLTVRPGFPVRVIITRDLVLEPWRG